MNKAVIGRRSFCLAVCALIPMVTMAQSHQDEYILMLLCDPVAGHESEFKAWWPGYIRSVAAVPGVISAEDFRRAEIRLRDGAQPLPAHLAFFAISAPDLAAVIKDIDQRTKDGRIPMSPAVNMKTIKDLSYRQEGIWKHEPPSTRGDIFLQLVLSNPTPGQDAEYRRWFMQSHGPELAQVAAVYQVELAARTHIDLIAGEAAASPGYLSAMRFETPAILTFKEGLERAARSFITPSTSYDIQGTWRETYQRMGSPIRGVEK